MDLSPGTRLGTYEVVAKIGEGGMGEVYRATDTNLKRQVAIKVLPASVAGDPERLARFQREAELLAALNHPNIAHIHGLERRDGAAPFLVLELVEGPTLADRIAEGAIPIDEALPIAKQIGDALEAAHEKGIIHRDLKPANIKVRPDGVVKVLDFGLAKAIEGGGTAGGPGADLTHSPTITSPAMTVAGMILGTAAYMAPEQAKGRPVDARADIWAFGVVLFEMLSGRRAFDGEDTTEVLGAVVRLEPKWEWLPASVPPRVRQVIQSCLRKNVKERIAHVQDVRLALEGAFETVGSTAPDIVTTTPKGLARHWPALAGLSLLVVAAATAFALLRPNPVAPPQPTRFTIVPPAGVTLSGNPPYVSPDGRTIAFQGIRDGRSQAYLRSLDRLDAIPVQGTETGRPAGFSPDGKWLTIRFADGVLKKLPLAGGSAVTIGPDANGGQSWSSADVIVEGSADGLWTIPAAGGERRKLTSTTGDELGYWGPSFLPDGRHVLYFGAKDAGSEPQVIVYSLDTGERRFLFAGTTPTFARSGHLIFQRQGALWATRFDPVRAEVSGEPVRIVENVEITSVGFALYDVARDGTLIYFPAGRSRLARSLVWVDRQGKETPLPAAPSPYESPRISPDGHSIVVQVTDQDTPHLAMIDLERNVLTPITFGSDGEAYPIWTRDGQRLLFSSGPRDGSLNIFSKAADGTGRPERLTTNATSQLPGSWSADGRTLVFMEYHAGSASLDVATLSLDSPNQPHHLVPKAIYPEVSPDGRWIAYSSDDSARNEVLCGRFRTWTTAGGR